MVDRNWSTHIFGSMDVATFMTVQGPRSSWGLWLHYPSSYKFKKRVKCQSWERKMSKYLALFFYCVIPVPCIVWSRLVTWRTCRWLGHPLGYLYPGCNFLGWIYPLLGRIFGTFNLNLGIVVSIVWTFTWQCLHLSEVSSWIDKWFTENLRGWVVEAFMVTQISYHFIMVYVDVYYYHLQEMFLI